MRESEPGTAGIPADKNVAEPSLVALALLCAGGELEGDEATAFERRLAEDQAAREALAQAVQLTQSLAGRPLSLPDPAYRERVRRHLLPERRGWRIAGRGSLLLAVIGLVAVLLLLLPSRRCAPPAQVETPAPVAVPEPTLTEALIWTQLQNSHHLSQALAEKKRRKGRTDQSSPEPMEDRSWRLLRQTSIKH